MEHESDGDTSCNWCARYSHQKIDTSTVGLGNKRTSGDEWKNSQKCKKIIIIIIIDELKKLCNKKVTVIPNVFDALGTIPNGIVRGLAERVGNQRTSRYHPNYCIKINQYTEKSPRDLRRLAVTETPVKDHQLTPVWKIRQEFVQEVWPYGQMVYPQHRIRSGERDVQISLWFWDTTRSSNLGQTIRPGDS